MKRILAVVLICLLLCGCDTSEPCAQQTVFCMDTVMDLRIWGQDREAAMADIINMLGQLEETWSSTDSNSFLSALNRGDATPDEAQQALLEQALSLHKRTGGAFDPQLYSVVALWGFYDDRYTVPTDAQLAEAKQEEKWDLGGIVKGYAAKLAVQILESYNVDRAILNLGGNVQTYGEKSDGAAWKVGIQNPDGGEQLGVLSLDSTMAVVTSGDYQRFFELDGIRYHHVLNPQTGKPADSGLRSVTVLCADGSVADALSTALFVMGLEQGVQFWQQSQDFEAVFVLSTGEIFATEGAALSGCAFEVINREN